MSIEHGIKLSIEFKGLEARITSKVVGVEEDDYIILKMPPGHTLGEAVHKLYTNSIFVARFMNKGTIYGFQSSIIKVLTDPKKVIFIEYPKKIETHDMRSSKRVDCYLPATIESEKGKMVGNIVDLSKSGCLVIIDAAKVIISMVMQTDIEVNISFHIPGVEELIVASAQQKSIRKDSKNVSIGLSFDNLDIELQTKLDNFLAHAGE